VQMRVRRRSVMMRQRTLRICRKMVWCPHSRTYANVSTFLRFLDMYHRPLSRYSSPANSLERPMRAMSGLEQL